MTRVSYVSKKKISHSLFTSRLAFRRAKLKWWQSTIVWSLIPRDEDRKARFNSIYRKSPKRIGVSTQSCLTPLLVSNESETLPSYWTVVLVLMCKDFTMLKRFRTHPVFNSIANSTFLLFRSKAFSKVNESGIQRHVLFFAFLLQLSHRENRVSGGALRSKSTLRIGIYSFGQLL